MKKLIAMIGAVAMSFCAFAATTATPGISFEAEEPGVDNTAKTFTPGEKWGWESDPLELGAYVTGEPGVYDAEGPKARRGDEFPKKGTNANYLKLDTGTADLTREMDADAGKGYVDQLVKFTGFEEPQTNLTAGIGVWMSEFVTNDTDEAATTDLTETNLYVTVGMGSERIALKIDDDYELDRWYRLTIKPLGDVFGGADGTTPREGFLVYINGTQVGSSDERATVLIDNPGKMTKAAKDAMDAGQLFTAINTGAAAAHTTVGYKGVGAIDDIILTDVAPAFTVTTVDVTFAPITGAIIAKVEDADGNEFDYPTGAISVKQGDLTVTLEAALGYKMKGTGEYVINTDEAVDGVLTVPVQQGDFAVVVATVTNGTTTTDYAADELLAMINGLVDGDTATFIADGEVKDGGANTLYVFRSGTTIVVANGGNWSVAVPEGKDVKNYFGALPGKSITVTLADPENENASLYLKGNIYGNGSAQTRVKVNGYTVLDGALTIGATYQQIEDGGDAVLDSEVIDLGGNKITLAGSGKVVTAKRLTIADAFTNEDVEEIPNTPEEGYYTYQIKSAPTPTGKPGISFEETEEGVNGLSFTPGARWTWNDEPLEIGNYAGENLPYGDAGTPTARRDDQFARLSVNNNYLKLDTGTNELVCAMDAQNGYVDQLMKFTGYEDIQTNFAADTKIAVWMGEICTNEETEATATNLYITVGKVAGGTVEQVALKIDGDYSLDTWYRLTVKPLGDIYNGAATTTPRAGFAVYINGTQVRSSDPVAMTLVDNANKLDPDAATLMANGQLFTAIDSTSVNFRNVAYNGIGAIDDIILTADKPAFIDGGAECNFTIVPPEGLYVVSVTNGNTELHPPYSVPAGTSVTITFGALPGYILKHGTATVKINSDGQVITAEDVEDQIEVEAAAAYVVNEATPAETNYVAEADLLQMVNGLVDGDTAAFIANGEVKDGEANTLYVFRSGTTIVVANGGNWSVAVPEGKDVKNYFGALPGKSITVTLADPENENASLYLKGNIYGNGSAQTRVKVNGYTVLDGALTIGATYQQIEDGGDAVLDSEVIDLGGNKITLAGSGKVVTTTRLTIAEAFTNDDVDESSETIDETTWYTYKIAAAPGTFNVTFEDAEDGSATITPLAGTSNFVANTEITVIATPVTDYEYAADSYEGWEKQANGTLTTNVTVTAAATFTAPAATRQTVTVTLPTVTIDGVSSLVVSQKVNEVWEEVTSTPLKIGVGNEYVVVAIAAEGYTIENPIASGTAAAGTPITVTEEDVAAKVKINTYTVTVPELVNFTVAVTNGETEVGTTNGVYTFNYASNVKVAFAAAEGYEITKDTSTNIVSLVENVEIEAPTVAIKTFTVTVNLGEDITALATNKTQGGEAIAFTTTGNFTVNYGDSVTIKYACSVPGYEPTPSEASNGEVKDNWNVPTSTKHAIKYTITIALDGAAAPEGWTPGEGVVTSNVTVETPAFTLPVLTKTDFDFAGYVKEGETATNKVVTIENTTASASYTACFTAAAPDVPVDDPTALDDNGKANATALAAAITAAGGNVNTWAATVYASGKIPAEKLNATTSAIIAIAVANDLPITASEPTFAVSASTVTAESGNVAAFEFTLKDGTTTVELKAITDKVKAMVRYTADLTTTFHQAAGTEVAITATPVEGKIKAELVKTAANAGFMKVEPQQPTVGGL